MGIEKLAFNTSRLSVRTLTQVEPSLENDLARILTDEVLAHLPPPLKKVSTPRAWILARLRESIVLGVHQSQSLIGLVFLADFGADVHLGYLLNKDTWGKGIASELIAALLPELSKGKIKRVVGGVSPTNLASARVLEKNGFRPLPQTPDSEGTRQYEWTARD